MTSKILKAALFSTIVFLQVSGYASVSKVHIRGTVEAFDQESVTIKQPQGSVHFPKKLLPKMNYKVGDPVEVELTAEQFVELNSTAK
jgi:type 1 fimbria pilin